MSIVLAFLVGIILGAIGGVLLAPAAHIWLGRREWEKASLQIELTDRLLESLGEPGRPTELHGRDR